MHKTLPFAALVVTSLALTGCGYTPEQRATSGAALGGATGAALGAATGGGGGAALAGGALGAASGAIVGANTRPVPPPPPAYYLRLRHPRAAHVGAMTPMAIPSAWVITATENYS
jgi:hypothetical protein